MKFRTPVTIPRQPFDFSHRDEILLTGSCFAENIGKKLQDNKFVTDINPFGTLYNPASVSESLQKLLSPEEVSLADLFEYEGVFHHFSYYSRFSSPRPETSLQTMNGRLFQSAGNLKRTERLIVTFGTAFVYRLKSSGQVVSNCHKLPEKMFIREMLSVDHIVDEWSRLLPALWEQVPGLKILFTVSPVRHWKDGARTNQLSKSALLLATDILQKQYPEKISYFPAYEIMMDELRDYRFYADDMFHPSPLAIDYIWETFARHFLTAGTKKIIHEWQEIKKAVDHRPLLPESEAYRRFISQTLLKAEHFNQKFPFFDITKEIEQLRVKKQI